MNWPTRAVQPIQPKQLRRLQALWRRWTARLRLSRQADRALRHYYVELFSEGRAPVTQALAQPDAAQVIQWLARLVRAAETEINRAAGTAGHSGYPRRGRISPNAAAWRALWGCAAALGMDRSSLESFILRHYAGVGLRGLADLRSMADLNRVLWGLKAIARRGPRRKRAPRTEKLAA